MTSTNSDLTGLLKQWHQGNSKAEQELFLYCYQTFKEITRNVKQNRLRASDAKSECLMDAAADTTALVHEAYIRIAQGEPVGVDSRRSFYANFGQCIYSILIDQCRKLLAQKRQPNSLNDPEADLEKLQQLVELEVEIRKLATLYQRQVTCFTLKYVCSMTLDEIAQAQAMSRSTVEKDLSFVKTLLTHNLSAA